MIIHTGTQERVISESTSGAGSTSREGSIQSDSLLATLWVDSVSSGTLTVTIYTLTDSGKEIDIVSFPAVSAPTANLLLKKSGVSMQRFRVEATYTGQCQYEVYVRAISGIGESSVRILANEGFSTDSVTVTTTPGVLIPSALDDRAGIALLNYGGSGTLWVADDLSKLPARAWPIPAGNGWSLDVASGVTIYAVSSSGSLDVRVAQSGG